MIKINKIKIHLFKYKNKNPVLSSFGRMTFRSSLIIELIDQNDNSGFGEIWCNFPNHAGRYRFEIFKDYFANLLKNFKSISTSMIWKITPYFAKSTVVILIN